MQKRTKFIISSALLSLGFIGINFLDNQYRYYSIAGLSVATLVLFYWSLREGLGRNATLLTLILPSLFTLGVGLFWFLLPATLFTRIPVIVLYGLGLYFLALTANIFTVSAIRTIALARAARGVGFVLTLLTAFLLFDAILSLRTGVWISSALIFVSSLLLFVQGLWISLLGRKITIKTVLYSAVLSTGVVQVGILLYFWPVSVAVGSLFLTVAVYTLLGMGQAQLEERLFARTVREYLLIGSIVFIAITAVTHWSG